MEDSFQFRQMQKLRSSLAPELEEPEVVPEAPPAEEVLASDEAWGLEALLEEADPAGETPVDREPREAIVARARAALQLVADLVARDPELEALVEEVRREREQADPDPS